jgi:DNA-binding NtrC family response regulator
MENPGNEKIEVVVVDDDVLVTRTLSFLFAGEGAFSVQLFNDPAEALRHLEQHPAHVVVADYLMPGMDGLQLLTKVRELHPESSRIVLTGYADKDAAIRAINEVGLYHFLEKPWRNEELLLVLRRAGERAQLLAELARRTEDMTAFREKLFRALL